MEEIKKRLSGDLKNAMKEKNDVAVKAIRSLVSALDNAGAVAIEVPTNMPMAGGIAGATDGLGSTEVPRRELSDGEIQEIIQKEIDEIAMAIELINDPSRAGVSALAQQIEILERYKN